MKTVRWFGALVFGFVALILLEVETVAAQNWYRGQLHAHSRWSDGDVFPEEAVAWHKKNGYNFVCLTDHHILQENPNRWVSASPEQLRGYRENFSDSTVREEEGRTLVRLKTIGELKKQFDVDGEFLLIPSFEFTGELEDYALHMNAINIGETIPYPTDALHVNDAIRAAAEAVRTQGAEKNLDSILMVNHPFWFHHDVSEADLIDRAEVRLVELNDEEFEQGNFRKLPAVMKYWDTINTFRLVENKPLLYGVGSEDRHTYPANGRPVAWISVNAPKLTEAALVESMRNGRFYISTGLELETLDFNPETLEYSVAASAMPGVDLVTVFFGTKKDFDPSTTTFEDVDETGKYRRTRTRYSNDIGKIVAMIPGGKGTYRLTDDDLFVRPVVFAKNNPLLSAWGMPVTLPAK